MRKELKERKQRRLRNKKLLKKYPWLTPNDWWFRRLTPRQHKYDFTLLDEIPRGWKLAFGESFTAELDAVLLSEQIKDQFYLEQVKEKYGQLTIYYRPCNDKIDQVIDKYSYLSENICLVCGRPDVPITEDGWICPLCKKCFDNDKRWDELYANKEGRMADSYTIKRFSKDGDEVMTYDISETAEKIRSRYAKTHKRPIE